MTMYKQLSAGLLSLAVFVGPALASDVKGDSRTDLRLGHMVYWVADLEKTSAFLTDIVGWERHPMEFAVSADDVTTGGMEGAFFDAHGVWLELILPTSPGPGMDILNGKGAGSLIELNFESNDYDATLADMRALGITMLNMDGTPLGREGGTIREGVLKDDALDEQGQRIAYWPTDLTGGSSIEIFDRGGEKSLINTRDKMWSDKSASPNSPRIDHIAIFVSDLEKTVGFYSDVMGFDQVFRNDLNGETNKEVEPYLSAYIKIGEISIKLVQPKSPGAAMDLIREKGDGFMGELVLEVDSLDAFYHQMKAKGVQMLGVDGTTLKDNEAIPMTEPLNTKMAYFPTDVSQGMVISVLERGSWDTDILNKRDASWGEVSP